MLKKMMCALFAAAVLLSFGVQAAAAEETGSLEITLKGGMNGRVALHKVGEPAEGGYRLSQAFGGGIVKAEDAHSPALAQWLAEQAGEGGIPRILDADGRTEFSDLNEGLYLLIQTEAAQGYYPIQPFLVTMPEEGRWNVQANPKTEELPAESPKTGDHPAPLLAAMGLIGSAVGLILCGGKRRK